MSNEKEFKLIQVSERVHKTLKEMKIVPREPFNEVIRKLIKSKNDKKE